MIFELKMLFIGMLQSFGYFVEGCAGFGGSVISSPINAALIGPDTSIPFATMLALPVLYYSAITGFKTTSWKDLGKILLFMAPGFILGNYLGIIINADMAKIGIGGAVTIIALMNIWKHIIKPYVFKIPEDEEDDESDTLGKKVFRYTCLIIGATVHGAFTIGGPLITVYTLNAVKDKYRFRSTMLTMWCILDTINAVRHCVTGRWTPEVLGYFVCAVPFTILGYYFGIKLLHKVNRAQFLRFIYVVLLGTGGSMFVTSLLALF